MSKLNQKVRLMKFGGTSVQDAKCIKRVAEIIADEAERGPVVSVVSAMAGVTNHLIEAAHRSAAGNENVCLELRDWLLKKYVTAAKNLIAADKQEQLLTEFVIISDLGVDLCRGTSLLRELTPRVLDNISSIGERLSARLMAGTLREMGINSVAIDASELIVTSSEHGQAEPLMEPTCELVAARLSPLLSAGVVPVVTGFIGATQQGQLTTLGRGGSDYSATILGAVLDAAEVVIWTDVDGVMSADPRLVEDARILKEITYNEAAELAHFGAKVLHPKTLRPVIEAGIPVWIRNSFAPERPGTRITATGNSSNTGVKAITAISEVVLITLGGRGIVGVPDVLAKVFAATASVRANVLLISQASSQNDICFVLHASDAEAATAALRSTFALELIQEKVEYIITDNEVAIIAVVGERMRGTVGIAGRTFSALGHAGVNVIAIAQGSSEYNISFVIEAGATRKAVAVIHQEFRLHESSFVSASEIVAGTVVAEL
jgi:bifunctional aspartokinase / homoserine dehydrogenase 1